MQLSSLFLLSFLIAVLVAPFVVPLGVCILSEDLNRDGKVDIEDFLIVAGAYGCKPGDAGWNPDADVVKDGQINIFDAVRIASMLGMYAPVASFKQSVETAPAGASVEFDPSDSYDPDGTIVLYEFDFDGDGVYDYSSSVPASTSFTYVIPGTYTVVLRVTDNDGLTDTARGTEIITPQQVIPEVPFGTIVASSAMIIALIAYFVVPRWRKNKGSSPSNPRF
jgi:hypothetical protein